MGQAQPPSDPAKSEPGERRLPRESGQTTSRCSPKKTAEDGCWRLGSSCPRLPAPCHRLQRVVLQAAGKDDGLGSRGACQRGDVMGGVVAHLCQLETLECKLQLDKTAGGIPYVLPWPPPWALLSYVDGYFSFHSIIAKLCSISAKIWLF